MGTLYVPRVAGNIGGMLMTWDDVKIKKSIYLNLGANGECHPRVGYENYIAVDINHSEGWAIKHDCRTGIPLPNGSVSRVHTEDFLEHVTAEEIKKIIYECFRILKPGGFMRIGVPDYNNPKDKPYLKDCNDPRNPLHITLTNYDLMNKIINETPFAHQKFYHYWVGDEFVFEKIDYSKGMVKRTPDNDRLCRRIGAKSNIKGLWEDFKFILSRGFKFTKWDLWSRRGHRLHVTSLVVDLFKD